MKLYILENSIFYDFGCSGMSSMLTKLTNMFVHDYKLPHHQSFPPPSTYMHLPSTVLPDHHHHHHQYREHQHYHATSTNSTNSNNSDNHTNAGRTTRAEVMTGARTRDRRVSSPWYIFFSFSLFTMLNIIHRFSNYGT